MQDFPIIVHKIICKMSLDGETLEIFMMEMFAVSLSFMLILMITSGCFSNNNVCIKLQERFCVDIIWVMLIVNLKLRR